jgi:single-stranded-DNA-specific exonuclease
MEKRWTLQKADPEKTRILVRDLLMPEIVCQLIALRGPGNFEEAKAFFRPQLANLHDPFLMKDMDKAAKRLVAAFEKKEKILIYGDYDVDGTTAVALMVRFMKSMHANIDFYIPHRYREGYGVSKAGIEYAIQEKFDLIISLDCGIKSVELVGLASSHGIDFIICDHHLPDDTLPPAIAILNAKQPHCHYPFKELCGCGVGFKLVQALCKHYDLPDSRWQEYLDLVAIAIAADIVPIQDENRILTYYGLQKVAKNPSVGVKALLNRAEIKGEIQVTSLVFGIAPRINAAGRMDDAKKAVELFIAEDEEKAEALASQLHADNTDRREVDSSITIQAIAMIEGDTKLLSAKSTLLYHPDWGSVSNDEQEVGKAKGVVGIVASRLIEKYYRPTIILTDSGDKVAGSARSVIGFNIYEAIHACKDLLENYGGHFYAAGLTLKRENVPALKEMFEKVVQASITEEMLVPQIMVDAEIHFKDITTNFYKTLCRMEPFGPENLRPVFVARDVYETGQSKIVKENHIKFSLMQNGITFNGIGFGIAEKFSLLQPNIPIDVAFSIDLNEWNGERKIQLKVIDMKQTEPR